MPSVQGIGLSAPSQLCIAKMNFQQDVNNQEIQEVEQTNKDAIMNRLILPTKREMLLTLFSQQLETKKKSVGKNVYKGNLCIDNLDSFSVYCFKGYVSPMGDEDEGK